MDLIGEQEEKQLKYMTAKDMIGTHDFKSFCGNKNMVRFRQSKKTADKQLSF